VSQSFIPKSLPVHSESSGLLTASHFSVGAGEVFRLFSVQTGAGKTTAMKMLTGLLLPTSGKATVAGFDVFSETESIKRNIGYMSQRFSLYDDLTARENIRFFGRHLWPFILNH